MCVEMRVACKARQRRRGDKFTLPKMHVDDENELQAACRLCGTRLKHTFIDLGMSPLCESIRTLDELDSMEPYFPLHALVCSKCFLVQLKEYVSPDKIFREYAYFSSYSATWVEHARRYCNKIAEQLALGRDDLVVEVASNDGYLLQHFLALGIPVLGIEPAENVAKAAMERGIPTRVDFFGVDLARRLICEGRCADLIICNNVLAQVPDLNDFVKGLELLVKPEGIITLEFPHLERLISGHQFDTIYHEHFSYFSFITTERLARRNGLKIIDVEELPTHGGSLRVYLARLGSMRKPTKRVSQLLNREEMGGFAKLETYAPFSEKVQGTKRKLLSLLICLKDQNKSICAYGAPGKGNTLLNYCGIGRDFLEFTVDLNPYKHDRFTPGMHIPIRPVSAIDEAKPDYVLILPWNLKDEIIRQMRHIGSWGGKFIIPIPEVSIVDPWGFVP